MTDVQIDRDGPAAPPTANGEIVFEHPWQARVFATTIALCERGAIDYEDFRRQLIAHVGAGRDEYWSSWYDALLDVLVERQLCETNEIDRWALRLAEHPPPSAER